MEQQFKTDSEIYAVLEREIICLLYTSDAADEL